MSRMYYLLQLSTSDGVHKWSPLKCTHISLLHPKLMFCMEVKRIVERYLPLVKIYNIDSATLVVLR